MLLGVAMQEHKDELEEVPVFALEVHDLTFRSLLFAPIM